MIETTLSEMMDDVFPDNTRGKNDLEGAKCVTIWLPADAKARYDKLQEKSNRRFSKKVREVMLALISAAEARSA